MINSYTNAAYFAATSYGEGTYNTELYANCATGDTACQALVDSGSQPGVPNAGLLQQPLFIIPAIIVIAVLLVGIEYVVRRRILKKRADSATPDQSAEQ